jgi:primosomal protein N' (replication factor Y) (superfamily II helicase)
MNTAEVVVFSGMPKVLSYSIPHGLCLCRGMRVRVPLRNSIKTGLVIELCRTEKEGLKDVIESLDPVPLIPDEIIDLLVWTSKYYHASIGASMQLAFPPLIRKGMDLGKISEKKTVMCSDIESPPEHTKEQLFAIESICPLIAKKSFHVFVLYGVTGSGKTEVYIETAIKALSMGRSVIYMVPEIALTPQTVRRINSRVPYESAVFHSGLNPNDRSREFVKVTTGRARFVIGTRSAVFAPLNDVGLIIVDEEHDQSYKQSEGVTYNARDLAIMRASRTGAVAILGSATPSIETYERAKKTGHTIIHMKERAGNASLPEISAIDMRGSREVISQELITAVNETLGKHQQALLFLNRRGFSSVMICPGCGEVLECRRCSKGLTYHKSRQQAVCHYCGHAQSVPEICPNCGCIEMKHLGLGIERIIEEIRGLVPGARILQMDSDKIDTTSKLNRALKAIIDKEVDIIVGTQMISKGHDFPDLTLVGIIHAEQMLYMPDFRAAERTFQQVVQVAGRAGRTMPGTRVILQTLMPEHPLMGFILAHDYTSMIKYETDMRKKSGFPPFCHMARCVFSSQKEGESEECATMTFKKLGKSGVNILGPSSAPIELIRNSHRWNFLVLSGSRSRLHACLDCIVKMKFPSSLKVKIDVDPYDML